MDREELLSHHDELCKMAKQLMEKKNHDYAGQGGDEPFANFTRTEAMGVCTTEQGFLVRVVDKVSRMSTFTSAGKLEVENETVEDAIVDIINYIVLFSAYLKDKDKS